MFVTAVVWERPRLHNSELEAKRDALQEEIAVTVELTQNAVAENARVAHEQAFLLVLLDRHSECMCHCVDTGKAQNTLQHLGGTL